MNEETKVGWYLQENRNVKLGEIDFNNNTVRIINITSAKELLSLNII